MTILIKEMGSLPVTTPGPGEPGFPGSPGTPPRRIYSCTVICGYVWYPPDESDFAIPPIGGGYGGGLGGFWNWECSNYCSYITIPGTPALPPVPAEPPTAAELVTLLNLNWLGHSRSIEKLELGSYFSCKLGGSLAGYQFCVGLAGRDADLPSTFKHVLYADGAEIKVLGRDGSGQVIELAVLSTSPHPDDELRIYRSNSNEITFMVIHESGGQSAYDSLVSPGFSGFDLYIYARLWAGGDSVTDAALTTSAVLARGSALASGTGSMTVDSGVICSGTGTAFDAIGTLFSGSGEMIIIPQPSSALASGTGEMYAIARQGEGGFAQLERLVAQAHETLDSSWGSTPADTPGFEPLEVTAYGSDVEPPFIVVGWGELFSMTMTGTIIEEQVLTGNANFEPMNAKGGDHLFGEAGSTGHVQQNFGPLTGSAMYEFPIAIMIDTIYAFHELTAVLDIILVFNSTGSVVTTISGIRTLIEEMVDSMEGSGDFSLVGSFNISMLENLIGLERTLQLKEGYPSLDEIGRVWCVNIETDASSQYEQYGFNSFFERNGQYYGVADDGIYLLEGDDDIGNDIASLIDHGLSDYGTEFLKRVENVYAGVSSEGRLLLRVDADRRSYIYEMRSSSDDYANHRFDIGRGLEGNKFRFVILNQDGDDFDLSDVQFEVIPLTRKI